MNRDERWDRAAEGIHFWPENAEIVAGRDTEQGGTWLGINKRAITNIRSSEVVVGRPSRGLLAKKLLQEESFDPVKWLQVIRQSGCVNFNLVFASITEEPRAFVYCSIADSFEEVNLADGPFTLANAAPGSAWPRERRLLQQFQVDRDYMNLLGDCEVYSEGPLEYTRLPIRILPTREGTVDGQLRGTVSSSVITVEHDGLVTFSEKRHNSEDSATKSITFSIN